jgi:hypothetical protein
VQPGETLEDVFVRAVAGGAAPGPPGHRAGGAAPGPPGPGAGG